MRKHAKLLANFLGAASSVDRLAEIAVDTAKGDQTNALMLGRALARDLFDLIKQKARDEVSAGKGTRT